VNWIKYRKHSKPVRELVTFGREQIYFSEGLANDVLYGVEWIRVYYDLRKRMVAFVPVDNGRDGAMRLSSKGVGRTLNASGLYRRLRLKVTKTVRLAPMVERGWIIVKYGGLDSSYNFKN